MTWKEREEQAAADLGMTREQYRMLLIRLWPYWIVGNGPKVRKRLFERQHGVCPLSKDPLNGPKGDVDHIRPKNEFLNDDLPILETIKACWAEGNIQLVHSACHKKKTKEQRNGKDSDGELDGTAE